MNPNAVKVLWQRQFKKYIRSKARIIGSLGQPLLFLLVFGMGFKNVFSAAGKGNYIELLAPGIIVMSVVFTAVFSGIEVIWDRQFGFLKETLVAPVSRFSIMFGKTLGGATVSALQGVIIFFVTLLVGLKVSSVFGVISGFIGLFILGALFSAFGILLASRLEDMQAFPIIMNFVIMPIFFLSGTLFPIDGSPKMLKIISIMNPLSYGVDFVRGSFTGIFYFNPSLDIMIMLISTIVVVFLGSVFFNKVQA